MSGSDMYWNSSRIAAGRGASNALENITRRTLVQSKACLLHDRPPACVIRRQRFGRDFRSGGGRVEAEVDEALGEIGRADDRRQLASEPLDDRVGRAGGREHPVPERE